MLAKMLQPTVLIIAFSTWLSTVIELTRIAAFILIIYRVGSLSPGSALRAITNFAASLESPNHWATVMSSVYT